MKPVLHAEQLFLGQKAQLAAVHVVQEPEV